MNTSGIQALIEYFRRMVFRSARMTDRDHLENAHKVAHLEMYGVTPVVVQVEDFSGASWKQIAQRMRALKSLNGKTVRD